MQLACISILPFPFPLPIFFCVRHLSAHYVQVHEPYVRNTKRTKGREGMGRERGIVLCFVFWSREGTYLWIWKGQDLGHGGIGLVRTLGLGAGCCIVYFRIGWHRIVYLSKYVLSSIMAEHGIHHDVHYTSKHPFQITFIAVTIPRITLPYKYFISFPNTNDFIYETQSYYRMRCTKCLCEHRNDG